MRCDILLSHQGSSGLCNFNSMLSLPVVAMMLPLSPWYISPSPSLVLLHLCFGCTILRSHWCILSRRMLISRNDWKLKLMQILFRFWRRISDIVFCATIATSLASREKMYEQWSGVVTDLINQPVKRQTTDDCLFCALSKGGVFKCKSKFPYIYYRWPWPLRNEHSSIRISSVSFQCEISGENRIKFKTRARAESLPGWHEWVSEWVWCVCLRVCCVS